MSRIETIELKIYHRVVYPTEVMFKWDAVGCSEAILLDLKSRGINLMRVLRVSNGFPTRVYFVCVQQFLNSDLSHVFLKTDKQFFVRFSDMLLQAKPLECQKNLNGEVCKE